MDNERGNPGIRQRSFAGGEIAPRFTGDDPLQAYEQAIGGSTTRGTPTGGTDLRHGGLHAAGERLAVNAERLLMLARKVSEGAERLRKAAAEAHAGQVLVEAGALLDPSLHTSGRSLNDPAISMAELQGLVRTVSEDFTALREAARAQAIHEAMQRAGGAR